MSEEMMSPGQRKKLFALLGEAGLKNREDRLSFARETLDLEAQDLSSFTELYAHEADDLILAINGWKTAERLRELNGTTLRSSISFVRRYYSYSRDEDAVDHAQRDEEDADGSQKAQSESDDSSVVRRPRRSGSPRKSAERTVADDDAQTEDEPPKKSAVKKRSSTRPASSDQSRSHTGRSSKSRSAKNLSLSADEIDYDLGD